MVDGSNEDPARTPRRSPDGPGGVELPPLRTMPADVTDRRIQELRRRLVREGTLAVEMLEQAIEAFRTLDYEAAKRVRRSDDAVDEEEVAIERECHELLALHHPYGRGFRSIAFALRVNADLERVADHATSIAKIVQRLETILPPRVRPSWPTAVHELMDRVPRMCHELLRAVLNEDEAAARALVASDETIDQIERRLFDEVQEMMRAHARDAHAPATGLLVYRAGRELERVGDLMASVAEDLVYLITGQIIRHSKRRAQQPARPLQGPGSSPSGAVI